MKDYSKLILDLGSYLCVSTVGFSERLGKDIVTIAPYVTGSHPNHKSGVDAADNIRAFQNPMWVWKQDREWVVEYPKGQKIVKIEFNNYNELLEYVGDSIEQYWRQKRN